MAYDFNCPNTSIGVHNHICIDDIIIDLEKHFQCLKTVVEAQKNTLKEKDNQIADLKNRNDSLHKAVKRLKDGFYNSQRPESCTTCKRPRTDSSSSQTIHEDEIALLDDNDEEELLASGSVMDIALNESALNATASFLNLDKQSEVITETEKLSNIKRRHLFTLRAKANSTKKVFERDISDENQKPVVVKNQATTTTIFSHIRDETKNNWYEKDNTKKSFGFASPEPKTSVDKVREKTISKQPKQSYLICHGNQLSTKLCLSRTKSNRNNTATVQNEDVFDFDRTATFLLDKSNNSSKEEIDVFSNKLDASTNSEPSVIELPNAAPPEPIIVDDNDSLKDFENSDLEKIHDLNVTPKIVLKTRIPKVEVQEKPTVSFRFPNSPKIKIKKEVITQKPEKKVAMNPILQQSQSSEEMDNDFEAQEDDIDLETLTCVECKNFLQSVGRSMTKKRKLEYLNKCYENHPQIDNTPDEFWNPHIMTLSENDPRMEILYDDRRRCKRT